MLDIGMFFIFKGDVLASCCTDDSDVKRVNVCVAFSHHDPNGSSVFENSMSLLFVVKACPNETGATLN